MIGRTVSHYKIISKLGEGGMGVVYKAEDTRLDRLVALKFLPKDLSADSNTRKRFIHEAKSASSLDHPNICAIHEIDETDDGLTFIVMPFYEGESLKEKIAAGRLSIPDALDTVIQVATGLAKAHERNIVHRDIKPANILITGDGHVKIVDFGVAKLAGQTAVTQTGTRVGTIGYMSPQQVLGEALDARSDIFSLGVVLYELLTGRLPYRGDVEAALLYAIVNEEHIPASQYRDDIPQALEDIITRALKKDVGERYESAAELIFDVDVLRQQLTAGRALRMGKPRRRRLRLGTKTWVMIAAPVLIAAAIGLRPVLDKVFLTGSQAAALAVLDFRDLADRPDQTAVTGLTYLVNAGLAESTPVRVISPEYLYDLRRRISKDTDGSPDGGESLQIAREAGATMVVTGQMGEAGGVSFVTWQLVDVKTGNSLAAGREEEQELRLLADRIIAEVLPVVATETGTDTPATPASVTTLTTTSLAAYNHYVKGLVAKQQLLLPEAIHELQRAVEFDSTFALALFELSRSHDMELERNAAREYAERAWNSRANLGVKDRMRVEAWRDRVDGNDFGAIATYREMLGRWPDDQSVLTDLTDLYFYNWLFGDAADIAGRGLALFPDNVDLAGRFAASLSNTGRLQEGVNATRALIDVDPENADAWDELGLRYLALGQPDSAEIAFGTALSITPDYVWSRAGLGYCEYVRGRTDKAIERFEDLLASPIPTATDSVELLTEVTFWPGLSLLYADQGRFEEALGMFEKIPLSETETQVSGRIHLMLRMGSASDALILIDELAKHTSDRFFGLYARHMRVRALIELGRLSDARTATNELETAIVAGRHPEPFLLLRTTANMALADGDFETALTAVDQMLRQGIKPGGLHDIERRESRAVALRMLGRLDEAVAEWETLLGVYGSHAVARYELGLVYEAMGNLDDARSQYEAFLTAWSRADEALPQVTDARQRLAALSQ